MNVIPHYCQNCGANNQLGEQNCQKCGTRLMLVVFPPSIRHEEGIVPSYYEEHLLERVTLLEIRLSQIAERLSAGLDLLLRQTKTSQTDHRLLRDLINSLNNLDDVEKDKLNEKKRESKNKKETGTDKNSLIFERIINHSTGSKTKIFKQLIKEGINLHSQNQDKQALRNLEQALNLTPQNIPLLLLIAQIQFESERNEIAKTYLENAFNVEPKNIKVLAFYGLILADSFQFEEAKNVLNLIKEKSAAKFCKNYFLGFIKANEMEWKVALEYFQECEKINDSAEIQYLIGCVYFQLKKVKSSHFHLQKAAEIDVNFADAWFMLAIIYQMLGDETKSFQAMEIAGATKESGTDFLKYLKLIEKFEITNALPFIRFKDAKKNLISGSSIRLSKFIKAELLKVINQ